MRVVFDMIHSRTASRARGIGRYVNTLMTSLQRLDPEGAYIPFDPGFVDDPPWTNRLTLFLAVHQPDVFVVSSPFELFRPLPTRSVLGGCRLAVIAYDLIPLRFPNEYLSPGQATQWYHQALQYVRECDMVLAISDATRKDLVELAGVRADRIHVIGGAVDEGLTPGPADRDLLSRLGIMREYVLYVGSLKDPRKNLLRLVSAFARTFPASGRPQLVLVSSDTAKDVPAVVRMMMAGGLAPSDVVFTGYVEDDVLVHLYRGATVVAYPSLWEGLGLPVLEAMACGTPVLTSNRSSMSEIAFGASLLVEPESEESIAAGLSTLMKSPPLREELKLKGLSRVEEFRWTRLARRALNAFLPSSPGA